MPSRISPRRMKLVLSMVDWLVNRVGNRVTRLVIIALIAIIAALSIVAAQVNRSDPTDVRIAARQLDDGRVEFSLQQRGAEGWGPRMLVRSRYFPADVGHNDWLVSSPYQITAGRSEAEIEGSTDRYGTWGPGNAPGLNWSHLRGGGFTTTVSLYGTTNMDSSSVDSVAQLWFTCHQDDQRLEIGATAGWIGASWFPAQLSNRAWAFFSFGPISQQTLWKPLGKATHSAVYALSSAVPPAERPEAQLFRQAMRERLLNIAMPTEFSGPDDPPTQGNDGFIITQFDLKGAFETPVQGPLERCIQ